MKNKDIKLEFVDLSLKYELLTKETLKEIAFTIEKGTKTLIVGPSGSGKSSVCKVINGLIPNSYQGETSGKYLIENKEIKDKSISYLSRYVSTILQDQDSQFIGLTVGEDVAFLDENNNVKHEKLKENVQTNLQRLKIDHLIKSEPHHISGGQKQKVSLAGLLGTPAEILLFDEPLANLDPESANEILTIFDDLVVEHNKTIIVVEHRIEEVIAQNFDKIIVINQGKIEYVGDIDDCLKSDLLYQIGLRKPLYLELLDELKIDYTNYNNIYRPFKLNQLIALPIEKEHSNMKREKTILEIKNLSFNYTPEISVLENLSFNLQSYEITALLGNNGSGKSTLLDAIMGINKLPENKIFLNGEKIDELSIFERGQKIGYVMQNPNHMITQNEVFDEVSYILRNQNLDEELILQKVDYVLEKCGLLKYKKWPIEMLSYGQKRRVTIASVLVTEPEILLLDEPTAGQDYQTFKEMMILINQLRKDGLAILLITHNLELALEYAQRTIILDHGKITAIGKSSDILGNKDILEKANLKSVSLVEFAELNDLDPIELMEYFIERKK